MPQKTFMLSTPSPPVKLPLKECLEQHVQEIHTLCPHSALVKRWLWRGWAVWIATDAADQWAVWTVRDPADQ